MIDELELERHGYRVFAADPNLWCPFADGTSFAEFLDDERTAAHMRENGFSERDIKGMLAYEDMFDRIRLALRCGRRATPGSAPRRPASRSRSAVGDDELISVVFEESIAETLERYVDDQRLNDALYGQGVIGAFAGPRDPGTASIKLMHHQGDLLGHGSVWGYVEGGMGRVSFAIAEAAREAGRRARRRGAGRRDPPGEGVELESGELIRGRVVVSQRRPEAHAGDARPAEPAGGLSRSGSTTGRCARRW